MKRKWIESDVGEFDTKRTDKTKIADEVWVPCRICWSHFERVRLTALYCHECEMGFCAGEQGRFHPNRRHFLCLLHDDRMTD
jgi:hypothetical protein